MVLVKVMVMVTVWKMVRDGDIYIDNDGDGVDSNYDGDGGRLMLSI